MAGYESEPAPKGRMIKVGQYDAYLSEASPSVAHSGSCILYVSDVLSIWSESRSRADNFAANGYTTLIIDLFAGDSIKSSEVGKINIKDWIENGRNGTGPHTPKEVDPIVEAGIQYLKEEKGFKQVFAVGYSFGARFVVRHFRNGIDAGYLAYPSFIQDEEFAAITGPISIAAAETDEIFPTSLRYQTEEVLKKTGNIYQISLYSGVVHGFFSAEHDTDGKHARFAEAQSFKQAIDFFNHFSE